MCEGAKWCVVIATFIIFTITVLAGIAFAEYACGCAIDWIKSLF